MGIGRGDAELSRGFSLTPLYRCSVDSFPLLRLRFKHSRSEDEIEGGSLCIVVERHQHMVW